MSASRTRIWYLIGTLCVGGAERTLVDLANGLDRSEFEVTIWTIAEPGPLAAEVESHVTVRSLGATSKADLFAPLRFMSALRAAQPDILQSFLFYDNTLASVSGLFSPHTTVITGVRAIPNDPSLARTLVRRITTRFADLVISNTEAGVGFIVDHGADPDAVLVVHNGRDLEKYRSGTATTGLRESFGIPPEAPIVGTVGRMVERKGYYDLLEAWPIVLHNYPDAHLLIVGDGPERNGLTERARALGIADTVHLPGTRDDVPALLDLMDVFAFPSHFEGLSGALLEAMAVGVPIVTTPIDGNSELVTDGESGVYVPVSDPVSLGLRIVELLSDPARGRELGERASTVATDQFTLDRMISDFERIYRAIDEEE